MRPEGPPCVEVGEPEDCVDDPTASWAIAELAQPAAQTSVAPLRSSITLGEASRTRESAASTQAWTSAQVFDGTRAADGADGELPVSWNATGGFVPLTIVDVHVHAAGVQVIGVAHGHSLHGHSIHGHSLHGHSLHGVVESRARGARNNDVRSGRVTPGQDWPAPPDHGPSFPFRSPPANPWAPAR